MLAKAMALQRQGDLHAAAHLYERLLREQPLNASALHYLGLTRFQLGSLAAAEPLIARAVWLDPRSANAWSDLGMVAARQGKPQEALVALDRALALDPDHTDALNNKGTVLKQMRRIRDALPLFERLTRLRPRSKLAWRNLGDVLNQLNDVEAAVDAYLNALQCDPADAGIRLSLGDAHESLGEFGQARAQYEAVLHRNPREARALSRLIQLRGPRTDPGWITHADTLVADPALGSDERIRLNVALGYHHDREGSFDRAFDCYRQAYDEQFSRHSFDSAGYTRAVDSLIETFSEEFLRDAATSGTPSERPVFIVGMPRSGTTLTEQILSSHSGVVGAGELSMLLQVAHQTGTLSSSHRPYPQGIREVGIDGLQKMARRYLEHIDRFSADAGRVTDKLPFNFMHVGLIALLFPNARIIHCQRDPMDNCLSCYFTSFAENIQFANNLETLGKYYLDYRRLMAHWERVLPGRIFNLSYERMVSDTDAQVRALLAHCGLEWEDACLRFHETRRGVRTPSRWQVRQPIYSRSVLRWRNYEAHLEPLRRMLAPLLEDDPDAVGRPDARCSGG